MWELLVVLTPIALIDSLSVVPVAIAPMVFLLGQKRPLAGALAFIAGIVAPYFPIGVAIAFGLDSLFVPLQDYAADLLVRKPHTYELLIQLVLGILMVVLGHRICSSRGRKRAAAQEPPMSPWLAFTVAALISLSGIWGALPYFAAVAQILRADLTAAGSLVALFYYNVAFTLPLFAIIALRAALGPEAEGWLARLSRFLARWGKRVIVILLIGLGAVLIADAVGWFFDFPLLPIGTG